MSVALGCGISGQDGAYLAPLLLEKGYQASKQSEPDEIYHLAGQSSVGLSFEQPAGTLESVAMGTLNLLEAIRFRDLPVRFYNASSSECFGDTRNLPSDEDTPFKPRSPYGVAKAAASWEVANYREAYGLFACSTPEDYVIATEVSCHLQDFVVKTFAALNLNWEDHVFIDQTFFRPTDISIDRANPSKARDKLLWQAQSHLSDIDRMMLTAVESGQ